MASRRDIQQRKVLLRKALLQACTDGSYAPGEMLPPLRELAQQYDLSAPTAGLVIRELVQEGVLFTQSTVGTFVGYPNKAEGSLFLLVIPATDVASFNSIRNGFEERIAQLGGNSLTLERETAHQWHDEGKLPAFQGILEIDVNEHKRLPIQAFRVENGRLSSNLPNTDMVTFDDEDGARQATSHLIRLGHSKIAFLGLHLPQGDNGEFVWSEERERGWRHAMEQAGLDSQDLAFYPKALPMDRVDHHEHRECAAEAAKSLVRTNGITAVVSTNAYATEGLIQELGAFAVPHQKWPAIVSFDEFTYVARQTISAMRQPWEDFGRESANILWGRFRGEITGPPQQKLVPMRLIPRLSCRRDWPLVSPAPSISQPVLLPTV